MSTPLLPIVIAFSLRLPGGAPSPAVTPRDGWWGPDKVKHFFVSAFAQSVGYGSLRALRVGHGPALAGASVGTMALGVGRELHDRRVGRQFSTRDLVWDAAGGAAASVWLAQTAR